MTVRSVKNQYLGINAHLHSRLQAEGGWGGFHLQHITYLVNAIALQVRAMGYTVGAEESLQIRRIGGSDTVHRPDAAIFDPNPYRSRSTRRKASREAVLEAVSVPVAAPVMPEGMALEELFSHAQLEEKPYRAVVIYDITTKNTERGKPIVWIEFLSPSNKGNSEDANLYRAKRMDVLVGGLVFVEIDYLHETPPTFTTLADYRPLAGVLPTDESDIYPYRIIVIDPRPSPERGQAWVSQFHVENPLPTMTIPLIGEDRFSLDFNIPYQRTFEQGFFGDYVDYAELPPNFDRYRPADQLRILRRMLTVMRAAQNGADLETAPLPLPVEDTPLSLEAALEQFNQLKQSTG